MKRGKKLLIVGLIILAIVVVGGLARNYFNAQYAEFEKMRIDNMASVKVSRGDLRVTVAGNGKIEFSEKKEITAKTAGEISRVNVKGGKQVKKGDVLAEIDLSDEVSTKSDEIKLLENRIKLQGVGVKEQSRNLDDLQETRDNTIIVAPQTGIISELFVKVGDTLYSDQRIGSIDDNNKLKLTLPFENEKVERIQTGQTVYVYLIDYLDKDIKTIGKVISVTNSQDSGQVVANVEVVLKGEEGYEAGENASFSLNANGIIIPPLRTGKLEWIDAYTLNSNGSGKVKEVLKDAGDEVLEGEPILVLENKNIDLDIEKARYNQEGAQLEYDSLIEQMNNLKEDLQKLKTDSIIEAPIDGIVSNLEFEAGDEIMAGTVFGVVSTSSGFVVPIQIDELDISKVKEGQSAEITLDALEDKTFNGIVDEIAVEGVNTTGIGSFEVVIKISDAGEMKPGMSANVEILVAEKKDTLILPIEAVRKSGDYYTVMKKMKETNNSDEDRHDESLNGQDLSPITLGLVSDSYVEVLKGLSEGDEVVVAGQEQNMNYMMPGMGGQQYQRPPDTGLVIETIPQDMH